MPRPLEEVFAFFSNPANLALLSPPWIRFEILTPLPVTMRVGLRLDYRVRVRGLPLRWQSRIDAWEPPHRFMDVQTRGPFRSWRHTHSFAALPDGTGCRDDLEYTVWGGALVDRWFVRRDVERIFQYREEQLRRIFG